MLCTLVCTGLQWLQLWGEIAQGKLTNRHESNCFHVKYGNKCTWNRNFIQKWKNNRSNLWSVFEFLFWASRPQNVQVVHDRCLLGQVEFCRAGVHRICPLIMRTSSRWHLKSSLHESTRQTLSISKRDYDIHCWKDCSTLLLLFPIFSES